MMDEREKQNIESEALDNSIEPTKIPVDNSIDEVETSVSNEPVVEPQPVTENTDVLKEHDYHVHTDVPSAIVETFGNNSVTTLGEAPEKKKSKVGIILIVLILLVVVACLGFYFWTSNPKYVIGKSIDLIGEGFEPLSEMLDTFDIEATNWTSLTEKGTMQITVDSPYLELLKSDEEFAPIVTSLENISNMPIELEVKADTQAKKAYVNLSATLEEEKVLDFSYLSSNNKQYLLLSDVYSKYIEMEEESELFGTENTNISTEDLEYVLDVFVKSFKKNIKPSYITKENEKVMVDGKEIGTTKVILTLNEKTDAEFTNNIIADLKNDKRANEIITTIYPEFSEAIAEVSSDAYEIHYAVNITKGLNKIVKTSLYNDEFDLRIVYGKEVSYEYVSKENSTTMNGVYKDTEDGFLLTIVLPETEETEEMTYTIAGKKVKDKVTFDIDFTSASAIWNMTIDIILTEVNKESYNYKMNITMSATGAGIKLGTITLSADVNVAKGATIEDVTDSVLITELSEEDNSKLENYFTNFITRLLQ